MPMRGKGSFMQAEAYLSTSELKNETQQLGFIINVILRPMFIGFLYIT
jgi:hypothetical protein